MKSESINTGTRFWKWCKSMGRVLPPQDIVEALNRSMDEGAKKIKEYLPVDNSIWRNYCSFLSGKGRRRV